MECAWKRIYRGMQEEELAEVERTCVKFVEEIRTLLKNLSGLEGTVSLRDHGAVPLYRQVRYSTETEGPSLHFRSRENRPLARVCTDFRYHHGNAGQIRGCAG